MSSDDETATDNDEFEDCVEPIVETDTDTNEYVVPFSDPYTKISADKISSYFDVEMAGLEPERYYTILIKSTVGGTVKVFDEDIMFKVING